PRMRTVRRSVRTAPMATARSRLSSKKVGPIESTTPSAARQSFNVRAISRAFASGGLISLGTPTRFNVCVTGSTWSSWAFGTCLMHTMMRIGRIPDGGPLTSIGLPATGRGASSVSGRPPRQPAPVRRLTRGDPRGNRQVHTANRVSVVDQEPRGVARHEDAVPPEPGHHARPEFRDQVGAVFDHLATSDPSLDRGMQAEPILHLLDF